MKIKLDESKCTGCGACEKVCPVDAIAINEIAHIDHEQCIQCGACVEECPEQALSIEEEERISPRIQKPMSYSETREAYGHKDNHQSGGRKGGFWAWLKLR